LTVGSVTSLVEGQGDPQLYFQQRLYEARGVLERTAKARKMEPPTLLGLPKELPPPEAVPRFVAQVGLMQEAGEAPGSGGMLAVRAGREAAEATAARHGVSVANDNSPKQVVLSGSASGLDAVAAGLREAGVRFKRLPVSGAFHSPAMKPVVPRFRVLLSEVEVRPPTVPVFSCVTAQPFDNVRERLAQALTHPVRWLEVMRALHACGVRRFVETGPGRVLGALVCRTLDGVEVEAPESPEVARA
jgi:[acyl-carrier-protein] S-malonyltransferase